MNVLGIIVEYNPIHNGHIYHLAASREMSKADFVVAVMSGNFTQRGEPALIDKWTRAGMAVDSGIDLVIELPFAWACNSAEYFAKGAVAILKGLGCVTHLSFGSESGNIEELIDMACFLGEESEEFKVALRKHLDLGLSFPKARELAVNETVGLSGGHLLKTPNNILAIEYLKALGTDNNDLKNKIHIKPITVKRIGGYHDLNFAGEFAGAKAIRQQIIKGHLDDIFQFMPLEARKILKTNALVWGNPELFWPFIRSRILEDNKETLASICGIGEGIENKLKKQIRMCDDLDTYAGKIKSKRYTRTAINRLLFHVLMGLTSADVENPDYYGRVLALNAKGGRLLRHIKKEKLASIPLITNINRDLKEIPRLLEVDILASDLYNLATERSLYTCGDHAVKPYVKM